MAKRIFILLVLAVAVSLWPPSEPQAGDLLLAKVTVPKPAKGKGERCVDDTDFMRRNHMNLLDHQRDETVHSGVRTKRYSLKGCIDCHAVNGEDGVPVIADNPKHFCRTCHDYAAVRIDCFQCHASRPAPGSTAKASAGKNDTAALQSYLQELRQ